MTNDNLLLMADSYKYSHFLQYPKGTTHVSSYIEARGIDDDYKTLFRGTIVDKNAQELVFFGIQAFVKQYLSKRITKENVDEAEELITAHGEPFNRRDFMTIVNKYDGYLPLLIKAAPEGTVLPLHNVMLQVINTDPTMPWLTSWIETMLLRAIWYPTTVATLSRDSKKIIKHYLDMTSDNPDQVAFKLHDFGARGVSSEESAKLGGLAHLVNFMGTDTVAALVAARRWYGESMAGFSVPAAEHSTITVWEAPQEVDAYRNMLDKFAKQGKIVAVVSDSYDIFKAARDLWGGELREQVLKSGATLVIRPDSGDPLQVNMKLMEILIERFGAKSNSKNFTVLNDAVRVIQGDGVNPQTIARILQTFCMRGWAADNITFGQGGALLQKVNRDTFKFAMKASAAKVNGVWRDVFKDPITDTGKRSKRGILKLILEQRNDCPPEYVTVANDDPRKDLLQIVYNTGIVANETTLSEVRERAKL